MTAWKLWTSFKNSRSILKNQTPIARHIFTEAYPLVTLSGWSNLAGLSLLKDFFLIFRCDDSFWRCCPGVSSPSFSSSIFYTQQTPAQVIHKYVFLFCFSAGKGVSIREYDLAHNILMEQSPERKSSLLTGLHASLANRDEAQRSPKIIRLELKLQWRSSLLFLYWNICIYIFVLYL